MSGLSVDTEALGGLAVRMARTRDDVAYAAQLVDDCAGGAGTRAAAVVAAALADFDDHWRYGLKKIVANLGACHEALRDATSAYEQVEHAIAGAAAGD